MKTLRIATVAALFLTACDFDVPDLNRPGIESLQNPTPSAVEALATGLLIGARKGVTGRVGSVVEWGILGREALVLTPSDPRFIAELLGSTLDPGSPNFGGNFWVIPYSNIRGANLLLHSLDSPALVGLDTGQKEAMRGFAKTIQALDLLQVVDAHDANGVVLDVDRLLGAAPAPIVTDLSQIYTTIEALLDDANGRLAAGTAFPFPLGSGFTGFDTPATFVKFNRALRARVAVYHQKYDQALTALGASFIDDTLPFKPSLGVYHAFGAGSGDLPNELNTTDILAHPSTVTDAEKLSPAPAGCSGLTCLDKRVQAKVKALAAPVSLSNHSSGYALTAYPNSDSPIPIIRNEELILLRAEANIGLGNVTPAKADLDLIRVNSGGLPARCPSLGVGACTSPPISSSNILDELLQQRRYSLLFEGGHRWIDLRRYGKLDPAHVAVDQPGDVIHPVFPIPLTETQGR